MFSETYPHDHTPLAGHGTAKNKAVPSKGFMAAGSAPTATNTSPSKNSTAGSTSSTPNKRVAFLINTIAKIDQLLMIWLSRPETQNLIRELLREIRTRIPEVIRNQLPFNQKPLLTSNSSQSKTKDSLTNLPSNEIPRFYFPREVKNAGEPRNELTDEHQKEFEVLKTALGICKKHNANIHVSQQSSTDVWVSGVPHVTLEQFIEMMKTLCGIPTFLSSMLYSHLSKQTQQEQQPKEERCPFVRFWKNRIANQTDFNARCFEIIKETSDESCSNYLSYADLERVTKEIIYVHPGLEFLHETPEFQQRYLETVITRILYGVSGSMCDGKYRRRLSKEQFVACKLGTALAQFDQQEDISQNTSYFSYEHFYVIYCKFWELDGDHDLLLNKQDLCEYSNRTLSRRIVDRIFDLPRPNRNVPKDKMTYEDFVWFILSEEDKNTDMSAEYWFKCVDIDGDGYLSAYEIEYIYQEQQQRMELSKVEPICFHDIFCQFVDMVKPRDLSRIGLKDIKRSGLAAYFFNVLFNFDKLLFCEQEPQPMSTTSTGELDVPSRAIRHGDNPKSEWNRFAAVEYDNLTDNHSNRSSNSDED